MEFKIQEKETDNKGSFYIERDGKRVAEMTFSKAGDDKIIIDHTEVDDSLQGEGAGKQLVEASVHYARRKGIKILPLCPFAKATIEKNSDWHDVL